jgi:hypothetical protein
VLVANGDYDGGFAGASGPAASADLWLIRGDPRTGGLVDDAAAARFTGLLGERHVITISRAPHTLRIEPPDSGCGCRGVSSQNART